MQVYNNIQSTLTCGNISSFPFPEHLKEMIKKINLENIVLQCVGLPKDGKYSLMDGKQLYYDSDLKGNVKVEKLEYSGNVECCYYLINPNNNEESDYFIIFDLLFFKGIVSEINFVELKDISKKTLKNISDNVKLSIIKINKIKNAYWYKYGYVYYAYIVRFAFLLAIKSLMFIEKILVYIGNFLTPL